MACTTLRFSIPNAVHGRTLKGFVLDPYYVLPYVLSHLVTRAPSANP